MVVRTHAGMKRSSISTNLAMRSMKALCSKVGRANLAEDLFKRAIFLSGRNNRICPKEFLYAFIPSKTVNA